MSEEGIVIYIYKRVTFFNKQKWAFRIIARGNGKILAHSEKYHNREDANAAARLILEGPVLIDSYVPKAKS